jgi:DNA-binding SARP family transcriptional activator
LATDVGDDRTLATAHTVAAMEAALRSDRAANDTHYLRALDHATAARDVLLTIRIRTNRGSRMVEEGLFQEAILELDDAIDLAELTGYTLFQALALSNRGEALLALGELEAAGRDLTTSRRLYERLGSRMVAYPLAHLGSALATRGDLAQARAAFEEAIASAEAVGDLQGLVPALAGLAVCLAEDDPEQATRLAARALAAGPVLGRVRSLVAAADVELAAGRTEAAAQHATEAATVARQRRDRAGLAEALERLALLDPPKAPERLDEAASIWESLRAPVGAARVELCRIELGLPPLSDPAARALQADAIAARMRRLGCRRLANRATELAARCRDDDRLELEIDTLGGFGVRRHGVAVPVTAWQSRKARDLLKILICSRGAIPRDQLLDALWPEDDSDRAGRRLSVTLSTLRAVLDPDKEQPADHVVVADSGSIRLDRSHVSIDVDRFLELGDAALAMAEDDPARHTALAAADALYAGELLSEDLYEDWAIALRERARDTYVRVARALARHASRAGDHDGAVRSLLALLERDAYDEAAHLGLVRTLVAAGRHGESRRAYRTYCDRMGELDVEAVPYPA